MSIHLTVLHMIGRSKMNNRSHDPNRMLIYFSVSQKKPMEQKRIQQTSNYILIASVFSTMKMLSQRQNRIIASVLQRNNK